MDAPRFIAFLKQLYRDAVRGTPGAGVGSVDHSLSQWCLYADLGRAPRRGPRFAEGVANGFNVNEL
jgi:hypothetical protein